MLKPGTYKLSRDVQNPKPDRRQKYDWRAEVIWKAGAEFVVKDCSRHLDLLDDTEGLTAEQIERIKEKARTTEIAFVGHRWAHHRLNPNGEPEQYAAIEQALEPIEESAEAMFTRLGGEPGPFARWLVDTKRLTPAAFEKLHEIFYSGEYAVGSPLTSDEIDGGETISIDETLLKALRVDNAKLRAVLNDCPFGVMEGTEKLQLMTPRHMPEEQICEWVQRVYQVRKPSNAVGLATIAAEGGIKPDGDDFGVEPRGIWIKIAALRAMPASDYAMLDVIDVDPIAGKCKVRERAKPIAQADRPESERALWHGVATWEHK